MAKVVTDIISLSAGLLSHGRSSLRRRVSQSRIQQARYSRSTKENCMTNGLDLTARKSWSGANFQT